MGYWAEIRNCFFEGSGDIDRAPEGDVLATISIDAWKTQDSWEEGAVIACVMLSYHGDILIDYRDNVARGDEEAQKAVSEAKKQLKVYYQEREIADTKKQIPAASTVFCLCEEFEGTDGIREFQILALSADKSALRQMMEHKIAGDEYGFIAKNGIDIHDDDHFITAFDCGFVEYYIVDHEVLCVPEPERKTSGQEHLALADKIRAAESGRSVDNCGPGSREVDRE